MQGWARARRLLPALSVTVALAAAAVPAGTAPASAMPAAQRSAPAAGPVTAAAATGPAGVHARAAELADEDTGARLWARHAGIKRPIASITKVMTALVVLRAGGLHKRIKVTAAAVRYVQRHGASSAGLIPGDRLTVHQLLAAMLLPSGCDAAFLLATTYGPGRRTFVRKMNALAAAMGLASTHFSNFDGLPVPTPDSTYSTPADLIRLGEQAMRQPVFRRIVAQRSHRLTATSRHHPYLWRSTNLLLGSYRGAIGIKTGTTPAAGDCLLFAARRGAHTLIGVVLHANPASRESSRFIAARRMLNWGFRHV